MSLITVTPPFGKGVSFGEKGEEGVGMNDADFGEQVWFHIRVSRGAVLSYGYRGEEASPLVIAT